MVKAKRSAGEEERGDQKGASTHHSSLITHHLKEVLIYCDGSSLGNGQEATRAAAVALLGFRGVWRAFGVYLGTATNQQAEIAAARPRLQQPAKAWPATVTTR